MLLLEAAQLLQNLSSKEQVNLQINKQVPWKKRTCFMEKNINFRLTGLAFVTVLLVGCASAPDNESPGRLDPLEGFNRTMFNFNYNVLDPYVLRRH